MLVVQAVPELAEISTQQEIQADLDGAIVMGPLDRLPLEDLELMGFMGEPP
jgi:hypothetical protein